MWIRPHTKYRQIVQIATTMASSDWADREDDDGNPTEPEPVLTVIALCDDGTLWKDDGTGWDHIKTFDVEHAIVEADGELHRPTEEELNALSEEGRRRRAARKMAAAEPGSAQLKAAQEETHVEEGKQANGQDAEGEGGNAAREHADADRGHE